MCIPVMEFCQELMQYPEEEQPYAKAVISSVLCGIITSMDIVIVPVILLFMTEAVSHVSPILISYLSVLLAFGCHTKLNKLFD